MTICKIVVGGSGCRFPAQENGLCHYHSHPKSRNVLGQYRIHPEQYKKLAEAVLPLLIEAMKKKPI